ncbi:unnamed protein product [Blepharisma stoltei]|uniref:Calmodulin n=1 Tax=Blepharisma stoltei TaxID=1481888 RepID=A0AAU9JM07_9CILI|nr:unnamed protein product [Blepharisma stoltei]
MVSISEEEKNVFDILDKERVGAIDIKDLGRGLRALGLNPTEEEVQGFIKEAQQAPVGKLQFPEFQRLSVKCRKLSITNQEDVRKFFESLDTNHEGFVNANDVKTALLGSGEPLEEAEIDAVIKDFDKGTGRINVRELVEGLFKVSH